MKNKNIVFSIIICVIMVAMVIIPNYSHAADSISLQGIIDDGDAFLQKGRDQDSVDEQKIKDIVIPVAQILVGIGNAVIVVGIAIMGIKYMMSSPDGKAKLKTQLVGLCISAAVIFGAEFIWSTIYNFLNSIT